jgi:hypothetical protein
MNCPHCGNRNPSTADHCLHCGTPFAKKSAGFFDIESDDPDSIWNGDKLFYIIGAFFVVVIGGSMFLFGFDTVDVDCVYNQQDAARYEASPEWTRDRSSESDYKWKRRDRMREGRTVRRSEWVRCYSRKTGHVDGALE